VRPKTDVTGGNPTKSAIDCNVVLNDVPNVGSPTIIKSVALTPADAANSLIFLFAMCQWFVVIN
jgi:hypothetical protein